MKKRQVSNMVNDHAELITKVFKENPSLLSHREQNIFSIRFGLIDGKMHTLQYVGNIFGVSRERIRQIEAKCASRLRLSK